MEYLEFYLAVGKHNWAVPFEIVYYDPDTGELEYECEEDVRAIIQELNGETKINNMIMEHIILNHGKIRIGMSDIGPA